MCISVLVVGNGKEKLCETVGALARALDLHVEAVSPDPPKFCLCNANLDELGARPATHAEGYPLPEMVIEIKAANSPEIQEDKFRKRKRLKTRSNAACRGRAN
jgi:hypothetical protein